MQWEAVEKDTYYKNLMAWFALEEVARYVERLLEDSQDDCYEVDGLTNLEYVESLNIDCEEWKENQ